MYKNGGNGCTYNDGRKEESERNHMGEEVGETAERKC